MLQVTPASRPTATPGRRLTPATDPWANVAAAAGVLGRDGLAVAARVGAAAETELKARQPGLLAELKTFWAAPGDWISTKWDKLTSWGTVFAAKQILGAKHAEWTTLADKWDPADVNHPDASEVTTAKAELARNKSAERSAVAALPADARAHYNAVLAQCATSTIAQRGIQKLLLDGKLPGAADLKGQGTLLAHLNTLATQPLAGGIDRGALVSEVVSEIETPERIAQKGKGTCGATTAQIILVRQNPAEYVRLIGGLSSPAGSATMVGGKPLQRALDWQADNDNGRSNPSRMFQAAVMQVGMSVPFAQYDNTSDEARVAGVGIHDGLMPGGLVKALTQLTGRDYDSQTAWRFNRQQVWDGAKQALAKGEKSIPVSLTWGDDGGHFVQVDKVAQGVVTFTNPWGVVQTAKEAEFFAHLTSVMRPKG